MKTKGLTHLKFLALSAFLACAGCGTEFLSHSDTNTWDDHSDGTSPHYGTDSNSVPDLQSCFSPDFVSPPAVGGDGANVGEPCKASADCLAPLHCFHEICTAPGPYDGYCDGIDVLCEKEGEHCANFRCVNFGDSCGNNNDCAAGFECRCPPKGICWSKKCSPVDKDCTAREGCTESQLCDFGTCVEKEECEFKADLRGTFAATSTLHLSSASDGVIGGVLGATQWLRDLLNGGGLFPGLSSILSAVVRTFLGYNLKDYQIDLILSLVDLKDILKDVKIEHTVNLDATCAEMYRGQITFDKISIQYRGQTYETTPQNLPAIGPLPPSEFGATMQCESLAFDEIYVDYLAAGVSQFAVDTLVQVVTKGNHQHLAGALLNIIDCNALASYVEVAIPIPIPLVGPLVAQACNLAVNTMVQGINTATIDKPSKDGWLKLKGEIEALDDWQLESGHWLGATKTDNLDGEFTAIAQ
ncbi:MAG: hypothetical protein MUC50_02740 [Myxococcota bacterium]|jgi:hypothetical protein|nr:hypothetical protein [Myxococcota bacterium]